MLAGSAPRAASSADINAKLGYQHRPGSHGGNTSVVAGNTPDRQSDAKAPDRIWITGIIYIGTLASLLSVVDLASATVFAITGALVASHKQMHIIGFMWLGVVTGVDSGTVRDLLLGFRCSGRSSRPQSRRA